MVSHGKELEQIKLVLGLDVKVNTKFKTIR